MKRPLELADATFRAYKKKSGAIVLHLRTYLIVYADPVFRAQIRNATPSLMVNDPLFFAELTKPSGLSAFIQQHPNCWLKLPGKKQLECEVTYSCYPVRRSIEHPSGKWVTYELVDIATTQCTLFYFDINLNITEKAIDDVTIADLKLVFHLNFPGRPANEKIVLRRKSPIVKRGIGW